MNRPEASPTPTPGRRGFTLVELLVVITIIAILAGLAGVAVTRALDTAKQSRIKIEVDGIASAFNNYKATYGSYPPCNLTNTNAVKQHIARAFPRYNLANLASDLTLAGIDTTNFRPDQALVFWLQGFSPDPSNPFLTPDGQQIAGPVGSRAPQGTKPAVTPIFSFDKTRLFQVASIASVNTSATPPIISPTFATVYAGASFVPVASYFPQGTVPPSSTAVPYLYWEAGTTTTTPAGVVTSTFGTINPSGSPPVTPNTFNSSALAIFTNGTNSNTAVPYWLDANSNQTTDLAENWVNYDSFQVISAGLDGLYGVPIGATATPPVRLYPTGTGYNFDPATNMISNNLPDDDNITNFNSKARLSDAKP